MFLGEGDHLGAAGEFLAKPLLPPGGDDLDIRRERGRGQLEAHLVVALAGRAVGDGLGAVGVGDLDHALGDERPGDAGAEEILAFVERAGLDHGEDEVARELLAQIVHLAAGRPGRERLGFEAVEFLALADIGAKGDHLRLVGFLEPAEDDRRVQAARIRDNDFHRVRTL